MHVLWHILIWKLRNLSSFFLLFLLLETANFYIHFLFFFAKSKCDHRVPCAFRIIYPITISTIKRQKIIKINAASPSNHQPYATSHHISALIPGLLCVYSVYTDCIYILLLSRAVVWFAALYIYLAEYICSISSSAHMNVCTSIYLPTYICISSLSLLGKLITIF